MQRFPNLTVTRVIHRIVLKLGAILVVLEKLMNTSSTKLRHLRHGIIGAILVFSTLPALAAELLMVEQKICPFCKQFHQEVNYSSTETGKLIPLRPIELTDPWPSDLKDIKHDMLTPTFILVEDGKELGRLRGYPGKEDFWALIKKLMDEHQIALK